MARKKKSVFFRRSGGDGGLFRILAVLVVLSAVGGGGLYVYRNGAGRVLQLAAPSPEAGEKALAEASRLADAVEGVETDAAPAFSAVPVENRIRAGGEPVVSRHSESRALFANAPAMKGRYFKVAGILE
ncbi:MAG TPA: hypothetical protein P5069_09515 [Candidatus Hydrogenedentes bacterium]|nr:hypothetical protein [Candidatus Hydrogenedentota bacterium]